MKKTVCDLCGVDCQETGFLIPDYNTYYATNCDGAKLASFDGIEKTPMDLCPECTRHVAGFMRYLRDHGGAMAPDDKDGEESAPRLSM